MGSGWKDLKGTAYSIIADHSSALAIVKPETVVAWHRAAFRLFWTWIPQMENAQREAGQELGEEAELISVELYGRKISFPSYAGEAVRFALTNPEFTVRDLPGDLDDPGKLVLVRRLIARGW